MLPLSASSLESIFNHLVLPPKLPGEQDSETEEIESHLTTLLLNATNVLRDLSSHESAEAWNCIQRSLNICSIVNEGNRLDKTSLLDAFGRLQHKDGLILQVAEQNAGLLIRRHFNGNDESVIFETFEASPASKSVLATENALQWDFPGSAVSIPFSIFANPSFQENLATFLEQASTESIKRFAAHTRKAGSNVIESRDTVDPSLISQMLMTLLEANGCRVYPTTLRKRVRDDVCWDNSELPWRRCARWLVLRVSVQRLLYFNFGSEVGLAHYKFLICVMLARFLVDSLGRLSPESCNLLKSKLCRRLAKLETDRTRAPTSVRHVYEEMFTAAGPLFQQAIREATEWIESAWAAFKNSIRRPIPSLPLRANKKDLRLRLPKSSPYLRSVLKLKSYKKNKPYSLAPPPLPLACDVAKSTTEPFRAFADRYFSLTDMEMRMESSSRTLPSSTAKCEESCMKLAKTIENYLDTVGDAYESSPEQMSIFILNLSELWMSMDKCATKIFPLLKDYHPGFHPQLLDVLQLPQVQDMRCLQAIQKYLRDRCMRCRSPSMTIFVDPVEGCFAARYIDESEDRLRLQNLQRRIEIDSENARSTKGKEWKRMSATYDELTLEISRDTCTESRRPNGSHDIQGCKHCSSFRRRKRLRISVHEDYLPNNQTADKIVQKKAIIFELGIPKSFAAYRDATWRILITLGYPKRTSSSASPKLLFHKYAKLKNYMSSGASGSVNFSLASTTKSFLVAHYKSVRLPVSLSQVTQPLGLTFSYYDSRNGVWPKDLPKAPTFAGHCGMSVPSNSPVSIIFSTSNFTPDAEGPSSYEVIASQTKCPPELTLHEFMAYQSLFSGKARRWLSILRELGSSNLNFSSEATMLLFCQLALQAGPAHEDDDLRIVHMVFRDESFCERLIEQIDQRMDSISSNWRETYCVEMLITLILRLCALGSELTAKDGVRLLEKVRIATLRWIALLREEVRGAKEVTAAERATRYALWASLLCRRTFTVYADKDKCLDAEALRIFIEASISVQENLVADPVELPPTLRNMLIRDMKMAFRMRSLIRMSIASSPASLASAINSVWPEPGDGPKRSYSQWKFFPQPYEWWVASTVEATEFASQQIVHYHLLEGFLFVDGKPLGKLPHEIGNSEIIRELFGNQHLLTFPSSLSDMTYMLAIPKDGHQIHFGFRNQKLLVRACIGNTVLEFVERSVFGSDSDLDLPAPLVRDCVHWLDLKSGIMEIRRQPHIWKYDRPGNWKLNFYTRRAQRRRGVLVDPHSNLFQRIAGIFQHFEYRHMLTIFQPSLRHLTVELKRLELVFAVNRKNLLESRQLRSEIDPNQDAGTLYGLESKIVLRDAYNPLRRSIIVPMGPLIYARDGIHIASRVENDGRYGRYMIDEVVGSLQCPPEPLLLYSKAQFHAFTSFVLPDPLTGRTGTEEALHCLRSGCCQPWTPIKPNHLQPLISIAKLTPRRQYYPKGLKCQQTIFWNQNLTIAIQHDGYRPVIEAIFAKSESLSMFTSQRTELPALDSDDIPHLRLRSRSRRRLYERPNSCSSEQDTPPDIPYQARDLPVISQGSDNVYEAVSLLRERPPSICTTRKLAGKLLCWPVIGGYHRTCNGTLSDYLDADLALEWGALVNLCRNSKPEQMYQLMFQLGAIAFSEDVDMQLVRTLVAFCIFDDLRILNPPAYPSFVRFQPYQCPSVDSLMSLIKDYYEPYNSGHGLNKGERLSAKRISKIEAARRDYEEKCKHSCREFASFLLRQWPCEEPTILGLAPSTINIDKAIEAVRHEWRRLWQNLVLSQYLTQVQQVLNRHRAKVGNRTRIAHDKQELFGLRHPGAEIPTLSRDLLLKSGPISIPGITPSGRAILHRFPHDFVNETSRELSSSGEIYELGAIIDSITNSRCPVRKQYGEDLKQSLNALKMVKGVPGPPQEPFSIDGLSNEIWKARQAMRDQFHGICNAFAFGDARFQWLKEGNLWPCITPVTLLEQLRSTSNHVFGEHMKESLISYAVTITTLQRLLRMKDALSKRDYRKLHEEQKNTGHANWRPLDYPDWLLLEIDANILIRNEQVDVALATIYPASGSNSVLQMNMGQGK